MQPRLSILAALALLVTACGPDHNTDADPVNESPDGGSSSPTEDLTVIVYEPGGNEPVLLEGAVVGLSQDGVVSMRESDAAGRATFAINPEGGPLTVSAYLPDHETSSVVGYEPATVREADGLLPLYMVATTTDVIRVSGELKRPGMDVMQTVLSSTARSLAQDTSDRFVVSALRGTPFVLTAYQQKLPALRYTPYDGMRVPMMSFRTLKHAGSAKDLDVTDSLWTVHDIANHAVRVTRPRSPASFADDSALLRMSATGTDGDSTVLVADTTALEPWFGQTSYAVTMSGRADLMASTDLTVFATIYPDADERSSTIRSQGALPSSIDVPFLPPPEVTTDSPRLDQPLSWNPGDASVWTFLYARVGSERWSVGVLPGIRSLDMPALLATLPTAPFRGRDLTAWLLTCESEDGVGACSRTAVGATFAIDSSAGK